MKANSRILLCGLAAALMLISAACSTTRRIPEGEQLYTGLKGVVYTPDTARIVPEVSSAIHDAVDVPPNNYWKLLGWHYPFPLGLWVYNNWPNPKSGLRHWLYEKLARDPVLVSDVRPEARVKMIDGMLDDNGYFRGSTSYELLPGKNPRKAKIRYTVNPGPAFVIDSVELLPDTTHLTHLIDSLARADRYLSSRTRYSTDSLSAARVRITNSLRNRGYYFFRPDYIEYLADSVMRPTHITLRLDLASNIPSWAARRYRTGRTTVVINRYRGRQTPDTVEMRPDLTLIQMQPTRLRRQIIPECVTFRKGRVFSVRNMNRTQTYLARLGIFRSINIDVVPDTTAAEPTLDTRVECTFDAPLEVSLEVNASSKSNSYIGPGLSVGLTNHNVFGGGEQLGVRLTGSYEWQTGSGRRSIFNSYEVGLTGSLAFPRMLAPKFIPRSRYQLNWTRFTLNADLLNRPHFFKMAQFNAAVSYDWRLRRHVSNTLTLFKLTYTNLMHTTADFDSIMAANPAVAQSFQSQFIPQMIYTYTYDRQLNPADNINFTFSVQEAGNIFWGLWRACGKRGEKRLFGTPFSQFVKGQAQVVWNRRLWGDHHLVSRVAIGAEHAYGNSTQVPYAEQFYVGGANSIRAFTVRSLGPGSYRAPSDTPDDYFDQTGTFKLEANVEYRFPIAGPLHGAAFLDAGNVWLLKADPARPGGELRGSTFLRDIALGTGVGLRFDISMLVIRADLGIGIHAPYNTGHGGYYNMESFGKSLAFHLAIGYPF
ncbi:MAG: BamA/TamA family outer membrane protein [Bacteroides sp.]|nr:BamA/TamA family outer membrane protein [Bacteroides sp.]MCM1095063.1 BamA/TamA family outer membrane protein [Terasakiella sp.]